VTGTGQHAVTWWSTDLAGNTEATHTGYVNVSNPYAQATGLANDDHSGWINTSGTVTITGGGDFAPFTIHYWLDGTGQTVGSPAGFAVSGEGSHQVDYYATNSMDQESLHQTGYVNIDLTAPVTGASGLQVSATTGWRNSSQVVTLNPTDNLSGVAHTYYTLDSGSQHTYTAPFTVSGEASHVVTWWSVDAAGNIEATHTGYVNIDTTLPTVGDDAPSGWQNAPVLVQLTPADSGGSLLAGTQYRLAGDPTWSATTADAFTVAAPSDGSRDGVHDFEYRALDNAGNASATGTCTVRIDTQAPAVVNDADAYWHNAAVTVHLSATDSHSGVKQVAYRPQGTSTWTVVTGATANVDVPSPADGLAHSYVYEYTATDVAGNTDSVATMTVNMDPRMPNTTIHGLPGTGWANAPVSITFTATPGDGAPISRTEYSFDGGGTWTTWDGAPVLVSTLGQTTITYRSVNTAGTVEDPPRVTTFGIDTSRPTCRAYKNVSVKRGRIVTLYYKVKDPLPTSGFAKVTIDIRGKYKLAKRITVAKAKVNAKLAVKVRIKLKKGTYFWKVKATDLAGNIQMKSTRATKKLYVK
jgi:hypothetical protein